MKKIKRLLFPFFTALLITGLFGCSNNDDKNKDMNDKDMPSMDHDNMKKDDSK